MRYADNWATIQRYGCPSSIGGAKPLAHGKSKEKVMKRQIFIGLSGLMLATSPAAAQLSVIDSSNLAKAIETARNTLKQIEEAQRLYDSANRLTDVGSIASVLNSDTVRTGLPSDIQDTLQLASSDLSELGSVGDRAQAILSGKGLEFTDVDGILASAEGLAARDQAIAEVQLQAAAQTSDGIKELKERLNSAETSKEVADLQARATLEAVQLMNQANQRQALKDAQLAADRLAAADKNKRRREANERAFKEGRFLPRFGN
jgi:type IV secretion system protein VirB5